MNYKIDYTFIKKVLLINFPLFFITGLIVFFIFDYYYLTGIIYGYLLSLINFTIGYISIEISIEKSINAFFKYLVGGMLMRIFLLCLLIIIILKFSETNVVSLLFSLFLFYIINLILELNYINTRYKNTLKKLNELRN